MDLKNKQESLLRRIRRGDEAAFAELCAEYDPLVRSMAAKYARMSEADDEAQTVQDFSQDAKLALYRAAGTYECGNGKVSFGLYAKVCIRNALVSEIRRMNRKRRADRLHDEQIKDGSVSPVSSQISLVDLGEIMEGDLLSEFEKRVLELYARGMKIRDIASAKGKSSKSVSNAVFRIKKKLRLYMDDDTK